MVGRPVSPGSEPGFAFCTSREIGLEAFVAMKGLMRPELTPPRIQAMARPVKEIGSVIVVRGSSLN